MAYGNEGVAFVRDEVKDKIDDWQLISDCIAGSRTIKKAGTAYLPMPNPDDTSEENLGRYMQYRQRAVFYNVTRRTHEGLTALAFIEPPTIVLPSGLDKLLLDIDGGGVGVQQQMQATLGQVAALGRCGLLTDYPAVDAPVSRASMAANLGLRPVVRTYAAKDIINWRTISIGARRVASLIVLAESYAIDAADGFGIEVGNQWRVLRLEPSDDGLQMQYAVYIYRDTPDGRTVVEKHLAKDASGKPMQEIPFVAVGSRNNDLDVDNAPMLDLATMNIAHYCDSADYQESVYMCGQPTPVLTGMTKEWWEQVLHKKVRLGSRSAVALPVGADLKLLQPEPNGLVREAMQDKERQMVALGARLIQSRDVQRTATEARIETASEMSVLSSCATNVAAGYVQALGWAGQYAGAPGAATVDIHANAELERMTAAERMQLMTEMQKGGISWTEYRRKMRQSGIATDDDKQAAIDIAARKQQSQPVAVPQQEQQQ
jgi:hypothetical protein